MKAKSIVVKDAITKTEIFRADECFIHSNPPEFFNSIRVLSEKGNTLFLLQDARFVGVYQDVMQFAGYNEKERVNLFVWFN